MQGLGSQGPGACDVVETNPEAASEPLLHGAGDKAYGTRRWSHSDRRVQPTELLVLEKPVSHATNYKSFNHGVHGGPRGTRRATGNPSECRRLVPNEGSEDVL